jgi:choline dehydrogenase
MVFQRGHPSNYDQWASLGNKGWSWKEVLPYFKKSQNQERGASECHGVGGPMNISDPKEPHILSLTLLKAAQEQGFPVNSDFNSGNQEGFGIYQTSIKNGMRHSTVAGYLEPARARLNLIILTGAHVTRLLLNNGECTGAVYVKDGKEYQVEARREVILSAGAINSPQILMLSGIGPKKELEELGIKLQVDLPGVGQNLQEHLLVPIAYSCNEPITTTSVFTEEALKQYIQTRTGIYASNLVECGGFVTLNKESPAPELQYHFSQGWYLDHSFKNPTGEGFTLTAGLVGSKSIGLIRLRSANPFDPPRIDFKYLEEESDMQVLVTGVKLARQIINSAAFNRFRGEEYLPGSAVKDDNQIREFIREWCQSIYHPVGTCKMGNDRMAVVNDRLEVYGVRRLRVADASIMPTIVNANTNTPCIMIGEKCADMIINSLSKL